MIIFSHFWPHLRYLISLNWAISNIGSSLKLNCQIKFSVSKSLIHNVLKNWILCRGTFQQIKKATSYSEHFYDFESRKSFQEKNWKISLRYFMSFTVAILKARLYQNHFWNMVSSKIKIKIKIKIDKVLWNSVITNLVITNSDITNSVITNSVITNSVIMNTRSQRTHGFNELIFGPKSPFST